MRTRFKMISLVTLAALAFGSTGWAHKAANNAVLDFQKGQSVLTTAQQNSLKTAVTDAQKQGQIAIAEVAVWADEPFPANNQNLSSAQQNLADQRADAIESYMKDSLNVPSVKVFNMAQSTNWLSKTFNTDDAELKSVFAKEASPEMTRADFNIIRSKGDTGKAVIVIKDKMKD